MVFHYVYWLTSTSSQLNYIGVRTSEVSPDNDDYMSSSRIVKRLIKEGTLFTKNVLSTWETRELANQEEARLHRLHDVGLNPEFANLACSPFRAVHGTMLKGRSYAEIFGEKRAEEITAKKKLVKRSFSNQTRQRMSENHANVSGERNPRSVGGKLFSKEHELLFVFKTKKELEAWCKSKGIPFVLLTKTGTYDPPRGNRNRNLAHHFGLYVKFDSLLEDSVTRERDL